MTYDHLMTNEEAIEELKKVSTIDMPIRLCEAYYMSLKALETTDINNLLDKTFDDFCNCRGGEGSFEIDGEVYRTDAGYALEGMEIFIHVLKKRLAEGGEI